MEWCLWKQIHLRLTKQVPDFDVTFVYPNFDTWGQSWDNI